MPLAAPAATTRGRGDRRRRRLDRRHGRPRRGARGCPACGWSGSANARQARRAQHRHRGWRAHDLLVMVDGDTVFEPDTVHRLVQPFADPRGRRRRRQRQGRPTADRLLGRWQHIEYVDRLQPRPPALRRAAAACRPSRARSARSAARRCGRSGGLSATTRSPRTPTSRWRCTGPAGSRVRGTGPRLDRGAGHRCASCGGSATAGATAPCRRCGSTAAPLRRARRRRAGSAGAGCRTSRLSGRAAPRSRRRRPPRRLRPVLPATGWSTAGRLGLDAARAARDRRGRLPPRRRAAAPPVGAAAAAAGLPPDHVPGPGAGRRHRPDRAGCAGRSCGASGPSPSTWPRRPAPTAAPAPPPTACPRRRPPADPRRTPRRPGAPS